MSRPASKPSKQEAENFHVLPKRDLAKEQARAPKTQDFARTVADRDAEAGSVVDAGDDQLNQSGAGRALSDRSRVS